MNVGLVSDPLFLHWLQSLFLSSWGNAFKDQENFAGSWVRFSWQCFQKLGRNPTPQALDGCGTAGQFGAHGQSLFLEEKAGLNGLNKHSPRGKEDMSLARRQ